jgi:hypothetical protein
VVGFIKSAGISVTRVVADIRVGKTRAKAARVVDENIEHEEECLAQGH